MRPVIEVLRARRRTRCAVTARDFAQTVALCERFGIEHEVIGRHRGGAAGGQGARPRRPLAGADALGAAAAASTSRSATAPTTSASPRALLRIPCSTMFDYEWATVQHNVNCRLAQAVVVPDAIPPERLRRYGARRQAAPLPRAQGGVLPRRLRARSGRARRAGARSRRSRSRSCARRPSVSLYHRFENDAVRQRPRSGCASSARSSCCRARRAARELARLGGFIVPEQAIDAPVARRPRRPRDQRRAGR